jgi:hypothetical protein
MQLRAQHAQQSRIKSSRAYNKHDMACPGGCSKLAASTVHTCMCMLPAGPHATPGRPHLCLQQRIAVAAAACNAAAFITSHIKVHAARWVGGAQPLQRCHEPLDGLQDHNKAHE